VLVKLSLADGVAASLWSSSPWGRSCSKYRRLPCSLCIRASQSAGADAGADPAGGSTWRIRDWS